MAERRTPRSPVEETLDTRGLYCPVPVLRSRDRLGRMEPGDTLAVVADDPVLLEDMPAFCRSHGHTYLGHVEEAGGVFRVRVRKAGAARG